MTVPSPRTMPSVPWNRHAAFAFHGKFAPYPEPMFPDGAVCLIWLTVLSLIQMSIKFGVL